MASSPKKNAQTGQLTLETHGVRSVMDHVKAVCGGFHTTGPGTGLFKCGGRRVHTDLESRECLTMAVPLKAKRPAEPWPDLEVLRGLHATPGAWKVLDRGDKRVLAMEAWTGKPFDAAGLLQFVEATLPEAYGAANGAPRATKETGPVADEGLRTEVDAQLHAATQGLPVTLRADERGWFTSYNTHRFLHKLEFELETAGAAPRVRITLPCESFPLRGDGPARAIRAFLFEANARWRYVRVALESVPREAGLKSVRPVVETALPVNALAPRRLSAVLSALVAAAESTRAEAVALSGTALSSVYLAVRGAAADAASARQPA